MKSSFTPNIAEILDRSALLRGYRPSVTYLDRTWTVGEVTDESRRLAQLLLQTGVSSGDRVMIVSRNSPYHFVLLAACSRIGAIMVPVAASLTRFEAQSLVDFCAPRAIVCSPEAAAFGLFESSGTLLHFVIDDDRAAGPITDALAAGYLGLAAAIAQHDGEFLCDSERRPGLGTRAYPTGPVLMQFVAGEASVPKAVCLTQDNLFWAGRSMRDELAYDANDVTLVVSAMSNGSGLGGAVASVFASGGHIVLARRHDADEMLDLIESRRVSVMFAVPAVYQAMIRRRAERPADLSSLRLPLVGGAPVPVALLRELSALGLEPLNVWGTTHMGGPGIYMPYDLAFARPGSIGHPLPYIQTRVVDPETLEDLPDGTVGELLARGPSVVRTFWHGKEYADAGFADGWLRTGDLVVAEGPFLTVAGRRHDRIVTGGTSVYPLEIEQVLTAFPGVRDVAVCGIPGEAWDEIVVAAVVLEPGAAVPELARVQEFCAQQLAAFKLPRLLLVLPSIPRDERGNPQRDAIRKLASSPSMPQPEPFPITATVPVVMGGGSADSSVGLQAVAAPVPVDF